MIRRTRRLAALAALIVGLAACGGGDASGTDHTAPGEQLESEDATREGLTPQDDRITLPAIDVLDVATGDEVALNTLLPSDRPLLVWFWAPH